MFSAPAHALSPARARQLRRFDPLLVEHHRRLGVPWVARLTALTPTGRTPFRREFLPRRDDYGQADPRGNGIICYWTLQAGELYEAHCPRTDGTAERRYLTVDADGLLIECTKEEVQQWLANVTSE
ncbi:hypothetical protein [Streptomyces sp. ST2-7A]|uniref:hypothetical protein n=1 Tax=Streptomyces sp. ST2-7A TaxID=2907214 RepID=UPI001F2D0B82|nr:hypothetical protein [Streptomyces sp. ST2-7A]